VSVDTADPVVALAKLRAFAGELVLLVAQGE
jgi:hypothetical protein